MQPDERGLPTALGLLQEMEDRVTRSSELQAEWIAAFAGFPAVPDGRAALRFREWFLLERCSTALGAVPVQAWSPPGVEADSAWERLLDNFLGIFRIAARQPDGGLLLEDLGSGRCLVWRGSGVGDGVGDDLLFVGRFVLDEAGEHQPLPGLLSFQATGLLAALERDLGALRAERPRDRLSQFECERLFSRLGLGRRADAPQEAEPASELVRARAAVEELLHDAPDWSLERLRAIATRHEPGELLDLLAFETRVNLELARRAIREWLELEERAAQCVAGAQPRPEQTTDPVARDRALALARFDQARQDGLDLEAAFRRLEDDLGLPRGATVEPESDATAVGPDEGLPLVSLIETYFWEREAAGSPLAPGERSAVRALGDWIGNLPRAAAASALAPSAVLAHLLASESPEAFDERQARLLPFLAWAAREQEEPLDDLIEGLRGNLARRLRRCLGLNRALARAGRAARGVARVAALEPLQVLASAGEHAAVDGLPAADQDLPLPGDILLGAWREGRFEIAGLLPREAASVWPAGHAGDHVDAAPSPATLRAFAGGTNTAPGTTK